MKPLQLTITETLTKEAAEQKINHAARQLIESGQGSDVTDLISAVIARAIPQLKSEEEQSRVYNMLIAAAAGGIASETRLSGALKRIAEITENQVIPESEPLPEPPKQGNGPEPEEIAEEAPRRGKK